MTERHVYQGATSPFANRMVMWLIRRGLSPMGAQIMTVRGRSTGQPRQTPVNPLTLGGQTYLVAPRGHVQWTRNLRVVREVELGRGRRVRRFTVEEVPDADKPEILRTYLSTLKRVVARYFADDGITTESTDEQWLAVAANYPVFRLTERS